MLHKRNRTILIQILHDVASVQKLSETFKVSQRTIRYDLDVIDDFLKSNDLPLLSRKGGISMSCGNDEKAKILKLLENPDLYSVHLSENRRGQIISILLSAKRRVTSDEIAKKLDVSKGTITNDLQKLRGNIPLEILPRYGISFFGDEIDIRESVVSFLHKTYGIHDIKHDEVFAKNIKSIAKIFKIKLTDNVLVRLVHYLTVAAIRVKAGHFIKNASDKNIPDDCLAASRMIFFETDNIQEHMYLAGLLANYFFKVSDNRAEVQILLLNVISNVEMLLGIDLMKDTELLKTLDADIQSLAGNRALFLPSNRETSRQLSEHYPDVYNAVIASLSSFEEHIGRKLSKEEMAPLVMPFVEAIQRCRTLSAGRADILVMCNMGQSTSRMLCYQLLSLFDVNIVDVIDFNQLEDSIKNNKVDMIISTIPLTYKGTPHVLVSPILTQQDIATLKTCLPTRVIDYKLFTSLLEIIEQNCDVHNPKQLIKGISDLLSIKHIQLDDSKPDLCDILPPENILLNVNCDDWRAAVRTAGCLLRDNGFVEDAYIEEMIENAEKYISYIVVAERVAMPHAGLNFVIRTGMTLVRLKTPVAFGYPDGDLVDMIFALCTPNKVIHLEALRQFSLLVSDSTTLAQIRKSESAMEIAEIIKALKQQN